jgi:hypothetical protein
MNIQSEPMNPGERAELFAPIPPGRIVTGVFMDPATAAVFAVDGEPAMISAGEMLAYAGINQPGVRVPIVHRGGVRAVFRAQVDLAPELAPIQKSIEHAFEDAWKRGGDPS